MRKLSSLVAMIFAIITLTACNAEVKETVADVSSDVSTSVDEVSSTTEGEDEVKEVVIYLTRHGKTMFNTLGRAQGWADSPLTEAGIEVAEQLGIGLEDAGISFVKAYSSDSGRSVETTDIALAFSHQSDVEHVQDKRLREWCFGTYEGQADGIMWEAVSENLSYADMDAFYAAMGEGTLTLEMLAEGLTALDDTGNAQNYEQILERLMSVLDEIAMETEASGGGNVLVVAHGMSINTIVNHLSDGHDILTISNAAVSKITYKNGVYTLETVNDKSYIEAGAAIMNEEQEKPAA